MTNRPEDEQTGDPRESLEERYGSYEEYRKRFATACDDLVKRLKAKGIVVPDDQLAGEALATPLVQH